MESKATYRFQSKVIETEHGVFNGIEEMISLDFGNGVNDALQEKLGLSRPKEALTTQDKTNLLSGRSSNNTRGFQIGGAGDLIHYILSQYIVFHNFLHIYGSTAEGRFNQSCGDSSHDLPARTSVNCPGGLDMR